MTPEVDTAAGQSAPIIASQALKKREFAAVRPGIQGVVWKLLISEGEVIFLSVETKP